MAEEIFQVREFRIVVLIALACLLGSPAMSAQGPSNQPSAPEPAKKTAIPAPPKTHRFWDKENDWLFAGVGASRTLDYFSTLNFRRRGDHEVLLTDDLVDNHAALAAVEAGATGLSIGVSYLFHRYGHHKLERWVSIIHIGATTGGAINNYCLKTVHTTPAP
ncbi:MAG TPA: hypothetical protein VJY15_05860 [Candidatus Acidoferrum sp.]|nr:hypothetical protein [Candidatus Acidoferrum sp.]